MFFRSFSKIYHKKLKAENLADFQNCNMEKRLALADRGWIPEKLLFNKLLPKMPPMTCTGT